MERIHADSKTEIYTKKAVYVIRKSNTTKSNHSQIHFVIKKKKPTLHGFYMASFKSVCMMDIRLT